LSKELRLNNKQKTLVSEHIDVVKWVIRERINVNERYQGMGYDDLFQEGCVLLCHAAATYDSGRAGFKTYASVVIRNGLLSYCRMLHSKRKDTVSIDEDEMNALEKSSFAADRASENTFDVTLSEVDVHGLLESIKSEYNGVARLGIEALELKIKGYSGAEIAKMWGVSQNNLGAWISRAKKRLLDNARFIAFIRNA